MRIVLSVAAFSLVGINIFFVRMFMGIALGDEFLGRTETLLIYNITTPL